MKTPLAGPNAMSRIRVFLIATCIIGVTPRLFGDIILVSRLSDAEATACGHSICGTPPPQTQTGFLPAYLRNSALGCDFGIGGGCFTATSTSNSWILVNDPMQGLRVQGGGTATNGASAKLIVLNFTLTDLSYPYSINGQLNGTATAKLTSETETIFERGAGILSENGTLPPGNYLLLVELHLGQADGTFIFTLEGPMSVTRATNLSTRMLVGSGNDVGIGGFIVTGGSPRHLLLRGIGPSLTEIIPNALPDPFLQLRGPIGFLNLTNDNWRDTQEAEIIATGRAPSNDFESAIVVDVAPGAYTALLSGNGVSTGIGLLEVYDLSADQESRLANISTRANVGMDNDIVIAGFILGKGSVEDAIVIRGLGPSLSETGVSALLDPKLELRDSEGGLIFSNDNWMDDPNQAAPIQASGLAPANDLESAILATLLPGQYTALLSGVNNGTGVGLVEVYENPPLPTPSPTPGPTPTPTPGVCVESFDHVTAPALPAGWVSIFPGEVTFATAAAMSNSPPNNLYIVNQGEISDRGVTRQVRINSDSPTLSFRNYFKTEMSNGVFWDGGVLEVGFSGIGGPFLDVTNTQIGGTFIQGGYTGQIDVEAGNPLAGRMAWSGDSGGYIDTVVNLGPNLNGRGLTFLFRFGTDVSGSAPGWRIDDFRVDGAICE